MRSAEDEPLAAGTVIDGRYRVIAELGAGGMGRVYEAEHMFIRRRMALKLLRHGAGGPEAAARMVQEATLAGQVPHPAVVRVFDCAALADGQVYVAMELLRGETLEQALRRPIDAATAIGVLAEVARGLAAVHRVGVVHRDIKPANIFLARGEAGVQAKLLDFGVAKALPGASELAAGAVRTQAGEVIGTPYYVAPEQVRGGAIDGRADLYSLGVILYEVLTGELPFVGDSYVAILAQHMRVAPLDPRQAAPGRGIPDEAARLAMRLLAKEAGERPADGDAVAEAIAGVLLREREALRAVAAARGAVDASTVRLAEESGGASGASTVRIAGERGGAVGGTTSAPTVRSAGDSVRVRMAERTGSRAWLGWVAVGLGAVGVAVWLATRAPVVAEVAAVPEVVVDVAPTPTPAPVAPVKLPASVVVEAPKAAVELPPAVARPIIKGKKSGREGGTTRPPITKVPAKVGDDPPLKPDVYGDD
jgi:hypothetical protein